MSLFSKSEASTLSELSQSNSSPMSVSNDTSKDASLAPLEPAISFPITSKNYDKRCGKFPFPIPIENIEKRWPILRMRASF